MTVYKVDGIGTRKNGSGGSVANFSDPIKMVRFFATVSLSKGDAVCLDFTVSANGLGNNVTKCDVDASATKQAIGIVTEDVTVSGTEYQLVDVQVQGLCAFADIDDTADANGDLLAAGSTAGRLTLAVAATTGVAILVTEGTPGSRDTVVYLLNPANL